MKKGMLQVVFIVMGFLVLSNSAAGVKYWPSGVSIIPEVPTIHDPVAILTRGIAAQGPVWFENSVFQMNGTNLQLDIFLWYGWLTVVTPWSYTANIGTLPVGTYDLTVFAHYHWQPYGYGYIGSEKHLTAFQVVVPEPVSVSLLLGGSLLLRRKRKGIA